jgi:hypothetical protein
MSEHPHPHGELVNENVHHEESDINIRAIVTFVVVLTTIAVLIQLSMYGLFKVFEKIEDRTETSVSPLAPSPTQLTTEKVTGFPAPSLQQTPWADLTKLRAEEAAYLHGYGWVDQKTGIGRIPIDRAKALLLEKGLAVRPEPVDASEGTHVAATGESTGGRNLPGGLPDKSSPAPPAPSPAAAPPSATVPPAGGPGTPKGPGGL